MAKDTIQENILRILLEKCGDAPPTGDYNNEWEWNAPDIDPFIYNSKKDQVYLTTWEGGHYSISYVNVPKDIAGVPLTFRRIESFYRPCDYRGKGSVHMYKTQKGITQAISARLNRGLRYIIRNKIAKKYTNEVFGNDIANKICNYL